AVAALRGHPYVFSELKKVQGTVEKQRFLPTDINYSVIQVDNCSVKQLDIIFQVLSLQVSPVLSSTFEFRQLEKTDPKEAAGVSGKNQYFRIIPRAGYDKTERFFGGGSIEMQLSASPIPLDSFSLEGDGSSSLHSI